MQVEWHLPVYHVLMLTSLAYLLVRTFALQAKIGASVSATRNSRRVVRPKQAKVRAMHVLQLQLETCIAVGMLLCVHAVPTSLVLTITQY